jgi:hypothetical protein
LSSRDGVPTLSLDELREIAESQAEDLQRQANQGIRKKDWEQGIGALAAIDTGYRGDKAQVLQYSKFINGNRSKYREK